MTQQSMTGKQLRWAIDYLGLTDGWVAKQLGVSLRTVQRWVTMDSVPSDASDFVGFVFGDSVRYLGYSAAVEKADGMPNMKWFYQGHMQKLEDRYPDRWANNNKIFYELRKNVHPDILKGF